MGDIQRRMIEDLDNKIVFEQAKACAFDYMDTIPTRAVFPSVRAIDDLAQFEEPLPAGGESGEEILKMLHRYGSPATAAQTGGRYFGFVNGGAVPTAVAARWLADVWDQNAGLYLTSPISSKLEEVCEGWLVDLLGLPPQTVAGFVGGTSLASFCGLAAARYELLKRLGWDVNEKGMRAAPAVRVVVGEQAHGSIFKALSLLGFGRENIETLPADAQGRMDASRLPNLDSETLLVTQAGNVNTGAFDDFEAITERAVKSGAWVHVDGAFGLWAAVSKSKRRLTAGIEKADSWSVDAHKTLNTPYDCGIVLCKHRIPLVAAMQASGAYLEYSDQRDGMLYVPEMSRRARSVELWTTLKYLGSEGIEQLVDGLCDRARQFAAGLHAEGFRVLNEVVFNQVLFAADTPEQTRSVLDTVQRSGICWCGGSSWEGNPAIRVSVCSWATTAEDVENSVSAFARAKGNHSPV